MTANQSSKQPEAPPRNAGNAELRIEVVQDPKDLHGIYDVQCDAFGRQTDDAFWCLMNPGWDTPEGKALAMSLLEGRFNSTTKDRNGHPNAVFVKATLPRSDGSDLRDIIGFAIWVQFSAFPGNEFGDLPVEDLAKVMDLGKLYPGNETQQKLCARLDACLHRQRTQVIKDKAQAAEAARQRGEEPPSTSVFALDICAVSSAAQGKGAGKALVQWGINEARARGDLECVVEASPMGRRVYEKFGFRQVGGFIHYEVEPHLADRFQDTNVFMRTRPEV